MFNDLFHGDDGAGFKTIFFADFAQCALFALTAFHAVNADHQTEDVDITLCLQDRQCFTDGGSGSGDIFNNDNFVAVTDGAAKQNAFVAVIFDLCAVGTVADISAVFFRKRHAGGH